MLRLLAHSPQRMRDFSESFAGDEGVENFVGHDLERLHNVHAQLLVLGEQLHQLALFLRVFGLIRMRGFQAADIGEDVAEPRFYVLRLQHELLPVGGAFRGERRKLRCSFLKRGEVFYELLLELKHLLAVKLREEARKVPGDALLLLRLGSFHKVLL